ncbi:MAG: hypothetical protein ACP5R0_02915 [Thermoplasmata archaeon]
MKFYLKNGNIVINNKNDRKRLESQGYSIHGKIGIIDPVEALFLIAEKNASIFEYNNELSFYDVVKKFSIDLRIFYAYRDLKLRGYKISLMENTILMKNGENFNFHVQSPQDRAEFKEENGFLAIVDDDFDLTYFIYKSYEPFGNAKNEKEIMFNDPEKERLFNDLANRNFKLNSGLKFGTEFIAYENNDDRHSKYMVKILRDGMQWIEIAGLARVANGVRKTLLIAIMQNKIEYYSLSWFRA